MITEVFIKRQPEK